LRKLLFFTLILTTFCFAQDKPVAKEEPKTLHFSESISNDFIKKRLELDALQAQIKRVEAELNNLILSGLLDLNLSKEERSKYDLKFDDTGRPVLSLKPAKPAPKGKE